MEKETKNNLNGEDSVHANFYTVYVFQSVLARIYGLDLTDVVALNDSDHRPRVKGASRHI